MASSELSRASVRKGLLTLVTGMAALGFAPFALAAMDTGGVTSQPIGHYEFCKRNPFECSIRPVDRGPHKMTSRVWRDIVSVNLAVNKAIEPKSDYEVHGRDEVWSYPVNGVGDCEDYVLEKRRLLRRRGISLSNLLITVVRKPDGEGHAVLTVRTDKGDYILDNLTDSVKSWDKINYRYLKRQATSHSGRWVSIRNEDQMLVGAVK
ncbi:MAG: transglutaminase-like cysteine peptidase [Rhizobiaceae bacterium]|nr:transglutaminase-like cysteine peptidase [Rhizobiaceae bacterium]MCV0404710.1 transglutaminase-like cysteine peptidase [Rhizobiaceae bacterium]